MSEWHCTGKRARTVINGRVGRRSKLFTIHAFGGAIEVCSSEVQPGEDRNRLYARRRGKEKRGFEGNQQTPRETKKERIPSSERKEGLPSERTPAEVFSNLVSNIVSLLPPFHPPLPSSFLYSSSSSCFMHSRLSFDSLLFSQRSAPTNRRSPRCRQPVEPRATPASPLRPRSSSIIRSPPAIQ